VLHLLNPVALRARMEYVPAGYPRRDVLAERVRVSASLISAEPATIAGPRRQLQELRESPFGRWLRPSPGGRKPEGISPDSRRPEEVSPGGQAAEIDLGRAIAGRAVVLFRLGGAPAAASQAMLDRLICHDLLAAGATRNRAAGAPGVGADGDGLIWLAECAALPRQAVTDLIARGRPAGLPVLAATTSAPVAAELMDLVNVVIAHRMADGAGAAGLGAGGLAAAADPAALRDGEFRLAVQDPPRLVPAGLLVRARVPPVTRDGRAAAPRRVWESA
jgi:hypothetical protein